MRSGKLGGLADEKLARFVSVGIVNTLFGTAVMFLLYNVAGCSYWISSAANYVLGSILSYILNRNFTFRHGGSIIGSGIRFTVNIAVCYFIAYGTAKPLTLRLMEMMTDTVSLRLGENIAMLVGMCIFTGLNYLGQRFFVFGGNDMDYMKIYDRWLKSPHLDDDDRRRLEKMTEDEIYEAFYKRLAFGTAGMRGIMGPGTNRINRYTVRMATRGLAELLGKGSRVAIAYDTRNGSKYFAGEAARVLAACGIEALLFDRYSPVPLLSFAVRDLKCDGGIVITASHNMPEYNGFKVYDETGCQLSAPLAAKIAASVDELEDELDIEVADADDPLIKTIGQDVIDRFMDAVQRCGVDVDAGAERDLKVVYTPIHGSGREYVLETLRRAGFEDVILVKEQAEYNGDFPTVKKPNPEEKAVFRIAEGIATENGADIIIGTDPDSDRLGAGAMHEGRIVYLSGNQTGALLVDFLARMRPSDGKTLITSIVTGDMGPDIAKTHGVDTVRTFTGFKDLGAEMNRMDEGDIFMVYEESYGYLTGTHTRDKDGISTAMLMCQMAAYWKQRKKTLVDVLDMLYDEYGYYIDDQMSFVFEGAEGARRISSIMDRLRGSGAEEFSEVAGDVDVTDYSVGAGGAAEANVLKYVFANGSWLAARPSGTEPKIKFYYCIKGEDRGRAEDLHVRLREKVGEIVGK